MSDFLAEMVCPCICLKKLAVEKKREKIIVIKANLESNQKNVDCQVLQLVLCTCSLLLRLSKLKLRKLGSLSLSRQSPNFATEGFSV